jgi:hypothetical protein
LVFLSTSPATDRSLLTALVAVPVPGVASAAPIHNRGLTINATPNPIIAGEGILFYGQLKGGTVKGQPIRLYHRVNPSAHFSLVGKTTIDRFGFYEFTRAEGLCTRTAAGSCGGRTARTAARFTSWCRRS